MLSALVRCGEAMPQEHYDAFDEALDAFAVEVGGDIHDVGFEAVFVVRVVLGTTRTSTMPAALDSALCRLAELPPLAWRRLRSALMDFRSSYQERYSVPVSAWLSELIAEVDGRRLDLDAELERVSDGGW